MPDLVLITGVTGHVGFAVLTEALQKGYTVRAAVRRESAIAEITSEPAVLPYLSHLTFVTVADLAAPGAFDEALESVTHVIHIASPLPRPSTDPEREIIGPAIQVTTGILESALKKPSIRKVVITSSVAAVRSSDSQSTEIINPDTVPAEPQGPYNDPFSAYGASKVKAHLAVHKFIAQNKPSFSIINIMPSFVIGPNRLAKTPEQVNAGSNTVILALLLGQKTPSRPNQVVHVDDVAFAHVAALDDAIKGVHNFGLALNGYEGGVDINQATEIVRKNLPKDVQDGVFPLGGWAETLPSRFDIRRAEEVLGFKHKSLEMMVLDLASYYAQAVRKTQGQATV